MKTIIYSVGVGGEYYYYIKELVCPRCSWMSVTKFLSRKPDTPWISHAYQYDGFYYRAARPFTFWKINEGESETVEDDHELVRDYVTCGHDKEPEG